MCGMISSITHGPFPSSQYRWCFWFKYFSCQHSTISITTGTWSFQRTQFGCCVLMILLFFCKRTAFLCSWICVTRKTCLMIKEPQFSTITTKYHGIDSDRLSTSTTGRNPIDWNRTRQFPVSFTCSIICASDCSHLRRCLVVVECQEVKQTDLFFFSATQKKQMWRFP